MPIRMCIYICSYIIWLLVLHFFTPQVFFQHITTFVNKLAILWKHMHKQIHIDVLEEKTQARDFLNFQY